jgi:hypothetical protein
LLLCKKVGVHSTALDLLRSIPRRLDSEYVFPGTIPGKPFADLKRQFTKAVKDAKLTGVSFHILRHSAASQMVMSGVDLKTVGEILRHKDYATTMRYAHLSPSHKKAAVDALGSALKAEAKTEAKTALLPPPYPQGAKCEGTENQWKRASYLKQKNKVAHPARLERAACGFEVRRSIQLSYGCARITSL